MFLIVVLVGGFVHGAETVAAIQNVSQTVVPEVVRPAHQITQNVEGTEVVLRVASSTEHKQKEVIKSAVNTVVPFYSQIDDISDPAWKGTSCGIASLAMLIDYYRDPILPDQLLQEGIANGAYIYDAGWSHQGLIDLAIDHGLTGFTNTMYDLSMDGAFAVLQEELQEGPVIVSVQYTFTPTNPIPHLVVITDVADGLVYYNDPADGTGHISVEKFQSSWKKRYIAIRPLD